MKSKNFLTSLILFAFIIISFSCGKSNAAGGGAGSTGGGGGGGTTGASVAIANMAFSPATLTVKAGTAITFTNSDGATHTATSDATGFNTGDIGYGASKSITITTAGTYTYHCNYHPSMTGTITVNP